MTTDIKLDRSRPIAASFAAEVDTFLDAAVFVEALPYARTSEPHDKMSVLREARGTCSTKHALLAALAQEQRLPHRLTLCFFAMSADTHPQIAPVLNACGLQSILEAHCVLSNEGSLLDFTGLGVAAAPRYLGLVQLHPDKLATKAPLHKAALALWAGEQGIRIPAGRLWQAREACIAALQQNVTGATK